MSVIGIHGICNEIVKVELLFEEKVWKPNRAINIINLSSICIQFTIKKRILTYYRLILIKNITFYVWFSLVKDHSTPSLFWGMNTEIYIIYIVKE